MIKILDDTKTLTEAINDTSNGLGVINPISATVTEELNGIYEAEIVILSSDKHFNDLHVGGLLQIPVNEAGNMQTFRIYFMSKPIKEVTIRAQHISYDLNKIAVLPCKANGAVNAKNTILNNVVTKPISFTMNTDISNTTSEFITTIPRSFRECLGGFEGSFLDRFKCEYYWDNLTVNALNHRGSDNNVRISYGKNLTDFRQDENIENVYTSVICYYTNNNNTITSDIYHKVVSDNPKTLIVDVSNEYGYDNTPTKTQLTTRARQYAENNDIEKPNVNLTISFVPLYQTEEYKNIAPLERVSLGDTVHVYFDKLNVETSARVVKTVWNALLNKYDSVELGSVKANLNTVLKEVTNESNQLISDNVDFLENQLNEMASLIINGLGLHRTLVEVDGGGYRIYLHNKENLADSDTQYIFTSEGFLVSTDYGQTWNAGFDSQGNAVLNSLATITLKALEINGGTITGTTINGVNINGSVITFGNTSGHYMTMSNNPNNEYGLQMEGNGYFLLDTKGSIFIQRKDVDSGNVTSLISLDRTGIGGTSNRTAIPASFGVTGTANSSNAYLHTFRNNSLNYAASIDLIFDSSNNYIDLAVFNSSNRETNRIKIGENTYNVNLNGSDGLFTVTRGNSEISINSLGDVTVKAARNLKLSGVSNIQINDNYITFGSDGNVKWSNK